MSLSPLTCPSCAHVLARTAAAGLNVVRCARCNGTLVNIATLRHRVEPAMIRALWSRIQTTGQPGARLCPSCRQPLVAFSLETSGATLELDACRRCQLVWFDSGELDRIRPATIAPASLPPMMRTTNPSPITQTPDSSALASVWDLMVVGDPLVDIVSAALDLVSGWG